MFKHKDKEGVRGEGQGCRTRSRSTRGQRQGRGTQGSSNDNQSGTQVNSNDNQKRKPLPIKNILTTTDAPKEVFPFIPVTQPGFYLPDATDTSDPETLFKLFFSDDIVGYICRASDEYVALLQDRRKVMHKYYKRMTPEDFFRMVALLIHFGYKKIPSYRLAWSKARLCYDPLFLTQ